MLLKDFYPKVGGAHLWLYEVYKRWPTPVLFLVKKNIDDAVTKTRELEFDSKTHGMIKIIRKNIWDDNISLLDKKLYLQNFLFLKTLRRACQCEHTRVHALRSFPEGITAIISKRIVRRVKKVVVYVHGEELLIANTSRQIKLMARWVYRNADLIIANSNFTKTLLNQFYPGVKAEVVHPGVDSKFFMQSEIERKAYRKLLNIPNDTIVLTTVARMEPRKNQSMVIKAVAKLIKDGYRLAYLIGGGGEEKEKLISLSKKLGVENNVFFLGYVTDGEKKRIFCSADIHIMISKQVGCVTEGFGIVFLEAGAAGIPSIGGKVGGQLEAVINGKTGLIVDGENLTEVKHAISYLYSNRKTRIQMGKEGMLWAMDNDWDQVSKRIFKKVKE